jgi:LmbE family N-acetylglucosaminyl deacetylase
VASVLVIAAHPDDEVLGCGGTIARHASAGDDVHVLIVAQGVTARKNATAADLELHREAAQRACAILGVKSLTLGDFPDNRLDSADRLDITRFIEAAIDSRSPQIVYTHHYGDANMDHRIVNESALLACRPLPAQSARRVLQFEIPSSTEWGSAAQAFIPNWFAGIVETLDQKLAALQEYERELRDFPHPRSIEGVTHLARWRGATSGLQAAEAFVLARNGEP